MKTCIVVLSAMWVVDVSPCQTAADSGAGDGSVAAASDRSQNIARLPS
jgi:hypothetical protein